MVPRFQSLSVQLSEVLTTTTKHHDTYKIFFNMWDDFTEVRDMGSRISQALMWKYGVVNDGQITYVLNPHLDA